MRSSLPSLYLRIGSRMIAISCRCVSFSGARCDVCDIYVYGLWRAREGFLTSRIYLYRYMTYISLLQHVVNHDMFPEREGSYKPGIKRGRNKRDGRRRTSLKQVGHTVRLMTCRNLCYIRNDQSDLVSRPIYLHSYPLLHQFPTFLIAASTGWSQL